MKNGKSVELTSIPTEEEPIDVTRLDEHWVAQDGLMRRYCDKLADAKHKVGIFEDELELVKAELDEEVRSDPEECGLEKLTEPAVKTWIIRQEKYQTVSRKLLRAKHLVDLLTGAVRAMDHRKAALENLVQLWSRSYFATPQAPTQETKETMDHLKKRAIRRHAGNK